MALTIDKASMVFLPTEDPNIVEVSLECTKDDLEQGVKPWEATWKSVTFRWNKNATIAGFVPAVQAALAAQREERTEQKTVKTAIVSATAQCKAVARSNPDVKPIPVLGSSADNPLFVKVI